MMIREARLADVDGITRVQIDSWRTTYKGLMPDEILDNLSVERRTQQWHSTLTEYADRNFLFVAEHDRQIVGFVSGGPERDHEPDFDGELYAIYLLQDHQGKGIGRKLTTRLADTLIQKGFTSMLVWVLRENPARKFYKTLGGKYVSEMEASMGDTKIVEVSYGWRDLKALSTQLKETSG